MLRDEMASGIAAGIVITGAQFRWPNCRVPFTIDPALPNQARVTEAIAHWEANTSFRFPARTTETDFITFRPGSGCSSQVGRRGNQQFVNLARRMRHGQHDPRDRPRGRPVARAEPRRPRSVRHASTGPRSGRAWSTTSTSTSPMATTSARTTSARSCTTRATRSRSTAPTPSRRSRRSRPASSSASASGSRRATSRRRACCARDHQGRARRIAIKEIRKEALKEPPFDTRQGTDQGYPARHAEGADPRHLQGADPRHHQGRRLRSGTDDRGERHHARAAGGSAGPIGRSAGGAQPFALVTPPGEPVPAAGGGRRVCEISIAQLDAQLQQLAAQLAQAEGTKASLQAQFNETSALLQQLIQQHEQIGEMTGRPRDPDHFARTGSTR